MIAREIFILLLIGTLRILVKSVAPWAWDLVALQVFHQRVTDGLLPLSLIFSYHTHMRYL
jgi:hypothetical protein